MTYHYRTFKGWRRITWLWEDAIGTLMVIIVGLALCIYSLLARPAPNWTVITAALFIAGLHLMILGHAVIGFRKENKAYRNGAQLYRLEAIQIALIAIGLIICAIVYL